MSEQKTHTPGPWDISRRDPDEWDEDYRGFDGPDFVEVGSRKWESFALVAVKCNGDEDEEGEANARLVAAAPELLAAAQSARMFLLGIVNLDVYGPNARTLYEKVMSDLNASCTKATGQA